VFAEPLGILHDTACPGKGACEV